MKKSNSSNKAKNTTKNNTLKNTYDDGNIPDIDLPQGKNALKSSNKNSERMK